MNYFSCFVYATISLSDAESDDSTLKDKDILMCIPDTVKARIRDLETSFQSGVNNKHGGSAYICWIQTVIVLIYWDNYRKSCE